MSQPNFDPRNYESHEAFALEVFDVLGVVKTGGHYIFAPKKEGIIHSDTYTRKDVLIAHPSVARELMGLQVEDIQPQLETHPDVIVGIAPCAAKLADHIAVKFGDFGPEPLSIFAEKTDGLELDFKRGYTEYIAGLNIVVAEDIVTSGDSLERAIALVRQHGGNVIGAMSVFNYNFETVGADHFDVPVYDSLVKTHRATLLWEPECQATGPCSEGMPVDTELGHGAAWVAENGQPVAG